MVTSLRLTTGKLKLCRATGPPSAPGLLWWVNVQLQRLQQVEAEAGHLLN